jgi:integrase
MLTSAAMKHIMPPFEGGVEMSTYGHVRYDKKSKSWFLDLWLKGKHIPLYRLPIAGGDMVTCRTEEMANTLQYVVSRQIDQGIFRPERFKIKRPLHLKAYAETWLAKQTHLGAATAGNYKTCINKYIIPQLGHIFITDLSETDLETFTKSLVAVNRHGVDIPLSPKSKDNVLGCIMKILHDAERNKDIDKAPFKPIMRGNNKVVDPEIIWLEPLEQEKILNALDENYRAIIKFGMLTGCRPSEARALRWEDVYLSRGEIVFRHSFDCRGDLVVVKGKKPLAVPIMDDLKALLDELPKTHEYVFINRLTGAPFGRNIIKVFRRASKKALGYSIGIAKATRTSFAQQLANSGMDIHMVSRWLRHSGTKVTKRYYEFQTGAMKSAVDKVRRIK